MQNSSRPARQIAALIQCHECIVRYSSILRREFIAPFFSTCGGAQRQTERERYMRRILICNAYLSISSRAGERVTSLPLAGPKLFEAESAASAGRRGAGGGGHRGTRRRH